MRWRKNFFRLLRAAVFVQREHFLTHPPHAFMKPSILFLGLLTLAVAGCTATGKKEDTKEPLGVFSVKIVPEPGNAKIHVTAYTRDKKGDKGATVADYPVGKDGVSGFVLPMGKVYGVQAFVDLNGNKIRDKNEPAGSAENLKPLPASGSGPEYTPAVIILPIAAPALPPGGSATGVAGTGGPSTSAAADGTAPSFQVPADPSKPVVKPAAPAPLVTPAPPESLPVPPPPPGA